MRPLHKRKYPFVADYFAKLGLWSLLGKKQVLINRALCVLYNFDPLPISLQYVGLYASEAQKKLLNCTPKNT